MSETIKDVILRVLREQGVIDPVDGTVTHWGLDPEGFGGFPEAKGCTRDPSGLANALTLAVTQKVPALIDEFGNVEELLHAVDPEPVVEDAKPKPEPRCDRLSLHYATHCTRYTRHPSVKRHGGVTYIQHQDSEGNTWETNACANQGPSATCERPPGHRASHSALGVEDWTDEPAPKVKLARAMDSIKAKLDAFADMVPTPGEKADMSGAFLDFLSAVLEGVFDGR